MQLIQARPECMVQGKWQLRVTDQSKPEPGTPQPGLTRRGSLLHGACGGAGEPRWNNVSFPRSAGRVVPGVTSRQERVGFFRTPTAARVLMNRNDIAENRIHHAPGRLDRILPGERDVYPFQGGTDQPIVRAHVRSGLQGEDQIIDLRIPAGAGLLADQAQTYLRLGPDPEPQFDATRGITELKDVVRSGPEVDLDLGGGDRHRLSGSDGDRHAGPAPGIQRQAHRNIALDRRMWIDTRHVAIALVLTSYYIVRSERAQGGHHPVLRIQPGVHTGAVRRVSHDAGQHLQHVVLHDIAYRPGPVVEPTSVGNVEGLGHRDLDALDVGPVEQRLQDGIGEAREQHIVEWVETEPVVDAIDVVLGEVLVHRGIELLRARQIGAERLLDHYSGALCPPSAVNAFRNSPEQGWRNLEVEQDSFARSHLLGHRVVGRRIREIAVHVPQQAEHLRGCR